MAHVAHAGASYIINGVGAIAVLRLILAFLLHNHLLRYNLLFFVDGQRTLYTAILSAFAWLPALQVILDWYHLEKRCKEQLSLALNGRVIRNFLPDQLRPCLWYGCVDRAIVVLQAVAPHQIKNQEALDTLIEYLLRNRPYIPCYAVRKSLSLHNSSNQGEKANDLVVSDRQKYNGMSWSKPGSVALTALTSLAKNQEYFCDGFIQVLCLLVSPRHANCTGRYFLRRSNLELVNQLTFALIREGVQICCEPSGYVEYKR